MEMVIMEYRGLLVINFFIFFLIISCDYSNNQTVVNHSDINLDLSKRYVEYKNKLFTGIVLKYYPMSNDTLSISIYKNGVKDNIWKKLYKDGEVQEIRKYKNGKKIGSYIGYYNNGRKKFEQNFKNGEYHGKSFVWTEDGRLLRESNFENGYESGHQRIWKNNGKIKSNYIIKNNRRYGLLGTKNCINASDSLLIK